MATMERARRATAGKRMSYLTGQALEDDEAFWGHDTWESDNESFRSADQEDAPDVFDSDFDETEESSDEEGADAAEREIAAEERMDNAKKRKATAAGYSEFGSAKHGRFGKPFSSSALGSTNKKSKSNGTKRIVGGEHNAGIVLNLPGGPTNGDAVSMSGTARSKKAPTITTWSDGSTMAIPALAARRERRVAREASGYSNEAREAAAAAAAATEDAQRKLCSTKSPISSKVKVQETFQQSDLLLEAVNETEPSNERWLLGRKRIQAEKDLTNGDKGSPSNTTYTEKFVSRRGYLNTINFVDMDHIPTILQQKKQAAKIPPNKAPLCVITGKPARYRDPKSGYCYYDVESFRAIRAKWETEQQLKMNDAEAEALTCQNQLAKNSNGQSIVVPLFFDESPTPTVAMGDPVPVETMPLELSTLSTAPAVMNNTSKRKPGRPKGRTVKKKTTIDTTSTLTVSDGIITTTTAPSSSSSALVDGTPPSSFLVAPVPCPSSLQLTSSTTIPSSTTLELSSRKSPRRRKPSTRLQESVDEGLLPGLSDLTTPDGPASSL